MDTEISLSLCIGFALRATLLLLFDNRELFLRPILLGTWEGVALYRNLALPRPSPQMYLPGILHLVFDWLFTETANTMVLIVIAMGLSTVLCDVISWDSSRDSVSRRSIPSSRSRSRTRSRPLESSPHMTQTTFTVPPSTILSVSSPPETVTSQASSSNPPISALSSSPISLHYHHSLLLAEEVPNASTSSHSPPPVHSAQTLSAQPVPLQLGPITPPATPGSPWPESSDCSIDETPLLLAPAELEAFDSPTPEPVPTQHSMLTLAEPEPELELKPEPEPELELEPAPLLSQPPAEPISQPPAEPIPQPPTQPIPQPPTQPIPQPPTQPLPQPAPVLQRQPVLQAAPLLESRPAVNTPDPEPDDDYESGSDLLQTPLGMTLKGLPVAARISVPLTSALLAEDSASVFSFQTDVSNISDGDAKRQVAKAEALRKAAWAEETHRKELQERLKAAWADRKIKDAFLLRREIAASHQRIDKLHGQAARRHFHARNASGSRIRIDVHGLFVAEAIKTVEEALESAIGDGSQEIDVIVGQGHNSKDGIPKLRPEIMAALRKQGISCRIKGDNAGVLIVTVPV